MKTKLEMLMKEYEDAKSAACSAMDAAASNAMDTTAWSAWDDWANNAARAWVKTNNAWDEYQAELARVKG